MFLIKGATRLQTKFTFVPTTKVGESTAIKGFTSSKISYKKHATGHVSKK